MDALRRPYGGAPAPKDERGSLPKGLWIGTAVFALLSAAALWFGLRMGHETLENSANQRLESAAVRSEQAEKEPPAQPAPAAREEAAPPASEDEAKRTAAQHWNAGLQAFQRGDYRKAQGEWELCASSNQDCAAGLQRIEKTYGGR
ncbi:MAG TPA: hypothetical protein DCM05_08355 [Elusimicrobia bacterium]|nr:hypothetical protein [Elusimicrobiota bacterium]